jgi:hypothetical protein
MIDRSIIEDFLAPTISTEVAHYTRIGTLCHMISPGGWSSARATPVQFLNDRRELALGLDVLRNVAGKRPESSRQVRDLIERLITSHGSLATDAFQMSFSGQRDELGQWRAYAANGYGCSVVTDASAVRAIADIAGWVIYEPEKQASFAYKVLNRLRGERQEEVLMQLITAAASFMKDEGFKPEAEFRLLRFPPASEVEFRENGERLVPFVDFLKKAGATLPVKKIMIGPSWQLAELLPGERNRNHVVQGIQRLLTASGLGKTAEILPSAIPYDPR